MFFRQTDTPFDNLMLELHSPCFFRGDAVVKINSCCPEYVVVLEQK